MDEKNQPVSTLQDLYATSAPIFANGVMHKFGLFQCTTGMRMMLVTPANTLELKCPICGKVHLMEKSFIQLSVDEFMEQFHQGSVKNLKA